MSVFGVILVRILPYLYWIRKNKDRHNSEYEHFSRHAEYKKMKHVLLQDIKTELSNFVQNKINEKLNSHNENQYKTLVDKTIILNVAKEIEFLKNGIIS